MNTHRKSTRERKPCQYSSLQRQPTHCKPCFVPLSITWYSNMTSFFRFVNKRASYPFGITSLAHTPVNVTDFSIGSMICVRHFLQT